MGIVITFKTFTTSFSKVVVITSIFGSISHLKLPALVKFENACLIIKPEVSAYIFYCNHVLLRSLKHEIHLRRLKMNTII